MKNRFVLALLPLAVMAGCDDSSKDDGKSGTIPSISIPKTVTLTEPRNAGDVLEQTLRVTLSQTLDRDMIAHLKVELDTAAAGDDKFANLIIEDQSVRIIKGNRTAEFSYKVLNNNLYQDDVTLFINLSVDENAGVTLGDNQTLITIKNSDDVPVFEFDEYQAYVQEGASYTLKGRLSHYTDKDVVLPLAISGNALYNIDYTLSTDTLLVPAKQLEAQLVIDVIEDGIPEGGEAAVLTINKPENATAGKVDEFTMVIPGDLGLNDTGMVKHWDGYSLIDAPSSEYPNQDAGFGRDTDSDRHDNGAHGFSFQKLDHAGNTLPSSAPNWHCVKDDVTGLVFEHKTPEMDPVVLSDDEISEMVRDYLRGEGMLPYPEHYGHWHAVSYKYLWYNPSSSTNGGQPWVKGPGFGNGAYPVNRYCAYPNTESPSYNSRARNCDTDNFLSVMNNAGVCGFTDWRLPTVSEIMSMVNYAEDLPVGAIDYFPNIQTGQFWTASSAVENNASAWCYDADEELVKLCHKGQANHVIAVRGGI
ncbi:DUF1566 domain-containing protein [Photobacterium sp. ZSDE20]|uniref:DUF1566 domain-containing protein n=1 Tax=Photobacterium pectinilyticum TaxID=2906793 RepID=A0ABT1N5U6_9GAMM|nr:DUF1566 domain-containing protein [Photobacterium sp. ZSDE20]MCQ1060118.1 DUF1566 domain-containing protein [Photobacterium sp. ZSDE20]MDD1827574.1 DUF1566 domain-containing protein [Photobacterium sp. ZSDE20]